jgi:hyperosmotically inducible periplasmic protein
MTRKAAISMLTAAALTMGLSLRAGAQQPAAARADLKVEDEIHTKLVNDPDLQNDRIEVSVQDGVAVLTGRVDTDAEKLKAERLAHVGGVVRVRNQLEVGSQGVKEAITDTALTGEIKAKILADDVLRHGAISVTTNNGVVSLSGTVPSEAARAKAVAVVRDTSGVVRVEDKLQVAGKKAAAAARPAAPSR